MKSGVSILIAALSLAMTVIASQGETVRAYDRKDGTHVPSYDRNSAAPPSASSSSAAPTSGSIDYNAIYSERTAQQQSESSGQALGQAPIEVTVTEPPSTTATSTIISDQWVSDTLNVYGTVSGSSVIQKVIGYDKDQQVVTESSDYTVESDGAFHAWLNDAKKQIRFLKVVVTDRIAEVAVQASTAVPVATVQGDESSAGALILGVIVVVIVILLIWFAVKSGPLLSNAGSSQPDSLPPPTPSESADHELVLADLAEGTAPHLYKLDGFLPKKGESVIWAFLGVNHYQKGTHSEWVGRSGGASVRVFKGFWVRTGASRGHKVSHTAMDYQGAGTLVLTTIGLCFIGANSTRIPLSHILAFQSYSDGIGFDTDYARNNRHVFTQIHAGNVAFIATVLDTLKAA